MKCAFTICTYSYQGLAAVVKNTFLKYHEGYDFFVIYIDKKVSNDILADDILLTYLDSEDIIDMHFKYDITEFSTSIKPFVFKYLFEKKYNKVLYFDPDIMFFSQFKEIDNDRYEAYVTPHKLISSYNACSDKETDSLKYGLYNCGFIGFNNTQFSNEFVDFWAKKLRYFSFNDPESGVYTDQKWVDFINIKMNEKVCVVKNLGCNFAPWNMDERILKRQGNDYVVFSKDLRNNNNLVFMHYSGFKYGCLLNGSIMHNFREFERYDDLDSAILLYGSKLKESETERFLHEPYIYGFYSNGDVISKLNRRLYRRINSQVSGEKSVDNPFDSNGELYKLFKKKRLIVRSREDVNKKSTSHLGTKTKAIYLMLRICKTILGIEKYTEFIRALHIYTTYEEQVSVMKIGNNE